MRIAIIGTGGVGGYLGAKLWKAGHEMKFIARGEHLAEMRRHGLTLESGEGKILVRSDFSETLGDSAKIDLGIVSVKSYDTESAVRLLEPALKTGTLVLTVQNGVENGEKIGSMIGHRRVMEAAAYIISSVFSPGIIRHDGAAGKFKFGEIGGGISERGLSLKGIFSEAGISSELTRNVKKVLWEKWIFICGISGMATYARKTIGEILADQSLSVMLTDLVYEATSIGRAKGIDPFGGFEEMVLSRYRRLPSGTTSSMHYDLVRSRRLEIEALNGAAVRFGKQLNIGTPRNQVIYEALKHLA